ncbi:MAG: hypothetical protein JF599_10995 [Verrucomicrobia bacterium]|nr:hypothetical protein [Verrucomicrobiota bacterium]
MTGFFRASLLILLAACLRAAPAVPLANLVDDRTTFVLSITDAPALLRGWVASPFAHTWDDPQVVKFFAPLREQLKIEEWDARTKDATGSTVRELLALAEGEVLVAVSAPDEAKSTGGSLSFFAALQVGDHAAKIEKLLADAAKDEVRDETEIFAGATVHSHPLKSGPEDEAKHAAVHWAMVDGVWLIGMEKERVFAAIDALKHGGVEAALGKNEHFLRARERAGDAQVMAYLNCPAIYPALSGVIARGNGENRRPNPFGLDMEAAFKALGLDALDAVYTAMHFDEKETRIDGGLAYTEERGLLKLLAYEAGPVARPDWIPAKWPSVSLARYRVPAAYAGLEEFLDAVSPMLAGMVQGQIRAFNRKLGVDLKRDLVGSLGNDMVSAYALPPGLEPGVTPAWDEMDQFIAISLNNVDAFTKAVEGLKQLAAGPAGDPLFTKRDYLGQTLYVFKTRSAAPGAKPGRGFTYAVANQTLLIGIGSPATVENALQGMADNPGSFWKREDVQTALAGMPADAADLQFHDLKVIVASLFEMTARLQTAAAAAPQKGKSDEGKKNFVDVSAKPDDDVIARYWGLASGYSLKTSDGLFTTVHIANPQP